MQLMLRITEILRERDLTQEGMGAAIGVGFIGMKAAEAVGRNPSAFGSILTMAIIGTWRVTT